MVQGQMLERLISRTDRLQAWHSARTNALWLQPPSITSAFLLLVLAAAVIAAGMNYYVRAVQYQKWEQHPHIFYLEDGTPLFTTTDAPYFLGLAQALKQDGSDLAFNERRLWPENRPEYIKETRPNTEEEPAQRRIRHIPLLSVLLSELAENSTARALLEAGNALIPITAAVTALMVMFAFGAAGYWLEGAAAAAGGGLSLAYLQRSGAGRIDTDQLNLGFFYLVTGLVILAARARSFRASIVLAALAGTVMWFFDWWYSKPFFGWAFCIGLVWLSLVIHRDIRRVLLQAGLFIGLSGLATKGLGVSTDSVYLIDTIKSADFIFPNTHDTITEVKSVPFNDILKRISGSLWLGLLSVAGLVLWGLRHPATAIVFGPAAGFALLNFIIGNRAIFYSAPMLWFGLSWLVTTALRALAQQNIPARRQPAVLALAGLASFVIVWLSSPTQFLAAPSFDRQTVNHFSRLKEALPKTGVIASWWDYGYMSMLFNNLATLHDGGAQTTPATYFIANSLLSESQEKAASQLSILANFGKEELIASVNTGMKLPIDSANQRADLYLVLSKDMAKWMPAIARIGHWDIRAGAPLPLSGVKAHYQLYYEPLSCAPTNKDYLINCTGRRLDLRTGRFGDLAVLHGAVIATGGVQISSQRFSGANMPFVLQAETGDKGRGMSLIHKRLFSSVYNQLFYLNRADKRYFTLVYDAYPDIRVFRVRGAE